MVEMMMMMVERFPAASLSSEDGADALGLASVCSAAEMSVPAVVLWVVGALVGGMVVVLASRALRVLVASWLGMGGGEGVYGAVGCSRVVIDELMAVVGVGVGVVVVVLVVVVVVVVVVVEVVVAVAVAVVVVGAVAVDCLDQVYLSLVCACGGDGRGEGSIPMVCGD